MCGGKTLTEIKALKDALKGGAGSGNFGHSGRPGERGGSGEGGGSASLSDNGTGLGKETASRISSDIQSIAQDHLDSALSEDDNSIDREQIMDSVAEVLTNDEAAVWESIGKKPPKDDDYDTIEFNDALSTLAGKITDNISDFIQAGINTSADMSKNKKLKLVVESAPVVPAAEASSTQNTPDSNTNPPAKVKFVQPSSPAIPKLKFRAEKQSILKLKAGQKVSTLKIKPADLKALMASAMAGQQKAIQSEIDKLTGRVTPRT
jgi:hypothetical protein